VIQPTTRNAAKGSHKCAAGVKGGGHCRTLASGDRHTLRRYRTVRGRNTGMQVAPGQARRTNSLKYCTEAKCNQTVDPLLLQIHKDMDIFKTNNGSPRVPPNSLSAECNALCLFGFIFACLGQKLEKRRALSMADNTFIIQFSITLRLLM